MSSDTTKSFYKNPSPDNNSVISRTPSQDTFEGELDPVPSGSAAAADQEKSQLHEASLAGSLTPVSEATATQDALTPANQKNKVEKVMNRGEGPGEEREANQVIAGVAGGGRPTLESNGEVPAKRYDDELVTSGPREPVPEVGGGEVPEVGGGEPVPEVGGEPVLEVGGGAAMIEESIEETIEAPFHHIAIPPEYNFSIPTHEFSSANNHVSTWKESRDYTEGGIKLRTTVSLSTDICQRSGKRTTSAVILITVLNKRRDCTYKGSARVIFHDPSSGTLLSESDLEERDFEASRDYIKFEVSMGSHRNIEQCRSKKLKLQVKVRVQEMAYWQNIKLVYQQQKEHTVLPS